MRGISSWLCFLTGAAFWFSLRPQESAAQVKPSGAVHVNRRTYNSLRDTEVASQIAQVKNVELQEGNGGRLSCLLKITLEEGNPWVSKIAAYQFDLAGDGRPHRFEFGPKIPIQTLVNNTISVSFINSGTTVSARARFSSVGAHSKSGDAAWFELEIDYARILERLATFANLPSVPYRDFTQIKTKILAMSDDEQELYTYDDEVMGRKLRISLRWTVAKGPLKSDRISTPTVTSMRYILVMSDEHRQVRQSYLLTTPSPYEKLKAEGTADGSFSSGVQIPVETQVNNTKSIQYIGLGVGAEVVGPRKHTDSDSEYFEMPIFVHYERLRERAFAAQAEIPYMESVEFEAAPKLTQRQQALIFQSLESIRGKTFKAELSWLSLQH